MIAAAPLVGGVISVGSSLLTQPNQKDPERFAKAQAWYYAATQGDQVALCNLKYMGGLRGSAPGGCGGAPASGFATDVAKAYTEQCYQQATRVLSGALPASTPAPNSPSAGAATQAAVPVISAVQQAQQQQQQQAVLGAVANWAPWILAGVGVVVLAVVVMRAQRG